MRTEKRFNKGFGWALQQLVLGGSVLGVIRIFMCSEGFALSGTNIADEVAPNWPTAVTLRQGLWVPLDTLSSLGFRVYGLP